MKKVFIYIYIIIMVVLVIIIPFIFAHNVDMALEQRKGAVEGNGKTEANGGGTTDTVENINTLTINVYMTDQKKIVKMRLEDYLIGVVAAEMPASFELEALKAQAVAARTYALGRATGLYGSPEDHKGADICTDPAHCQAWISKETAMRRWGLISSFNNWNKICKAVQETSGQVIEYEGVIINPLFHSNSGGHTENSEDVWDGTAEPYLRGVASPGEDTFSEYKGEVVMKQEDMVKKLKEFNPKLVIKNKDLMSNIKIQKYSSGDRVMSMKIGNVTLKGTDFRTLFKLKSTNFKMSKLPDGRISITTIGYGHGVGMSQCGADYLAKEGKNYADILKYYYQGVDLKKVS